MRWHASKPVVHGQQRRPTSDAVARLPNILTVYGPQSDAFLSRLMGPKAELEALGLLDEDEGEDDGGTGDGDTPPSAAAAALQTEDSLAELSRAVGSKRAAKRAAKARNRRMSQAEVTVTFAGLQMEETKEFQERLEALETQEKEREKRPSIVTMGSSSRCQPRRVRAILPDLTCRRCATSKWMGMKTRRTMGGALLDRWAERDALIEESREPLVVSANGTMSKRVPKHLPSTREEVADAEEELALGRRTTMTTTRSCLYHQLCYRRSLLRVTRHTRG